MGKTELFIDLVRRPLRFKIMALLAKHGSMKPKEISILLDRRYRRQAIYDTLRWLRRNNLVVRRQHAIVSLNTEDPFVRSIVKFINALDNETWGAFETGVLGSRGRAKILTTLARGPATKTRLTIITGQNAKYTELLLEPLLKHNLIVADGVEYIIYELNHNHPLIAALLDLFREIGVDVGGDGNNKYIEPARRIVDYIIENWDRYVVNPHNKGTVKLTGKAIANIAEKLGIKVRHYGWLTTYVVEEFKKRGFKVQVVRSLWHRIVVERIKIYVSSG
jgi:hypothetical protein